MTIKELQTIQEKYPKYKDKIQLLIDRKTTKPVKVKWSTAVGYILEEERIFYSKLRGLARVLLEVERKKMGLTKKPHRKNTKVS